MQRPIKPKTKTDGEFLFIGGSYDGQTHYVAKAGGNFNLLHPDSPAEVYECRKIKGCMIYLLTSIEPIDAAEKLRKYLGAKLVERHSQKMAIGEYRQQTGSGDEIKETPLSAQIANLMTSLGLENDRMQTGKLYVVTEYKSKKTGKTKEHGRWIQMAKKGTPDRWCLINGKLVFVEVKTKGKKPTPIQLQRQKELTAAGAICINVDSLEDAHVKLAALKKELEK